MKTQAVRNRPLAIAISSILWLYIGPCTSSEAHQVTHLDEAVQPRADSINRFCDDIQREDADVLESTRANLAIKSPDDFRAEIVKWCIVDSVSVKSALLSEPVLVRLRCDTTPFLHDMTGNRLYWYCRVSVSDTTKFAWTRLFPRCSEWDVYFRAEDAQLYCVRSVVSQLDRAFVGSDGPPANDDPLWDEFAGEASIRSRFSESWILPVTVPIPPHGLNSVSNALGRTLPPLPDSKPETLSCAREVIFLPVVCEREQVISTAGTVETLPDGRNFVRNPDSETSKTQSYRWMVLYRGCVADELWRTADINKMYQLILRGYQRMVVDPDREVIVDVLPTPRPVFRVKPLEDDMRARKQRANNVLDKSNLNNQGR